MPGSGPGKGAYGCIVAGVARSCIAAIAQPDSRGLDPGIHALAAEITKAQEDVDAHGSSPWAEGPRVKPGHGDLRLSKDRCRQPISLNRTAVGLTRPSTSRGTRPAGFRGYPAQGRARRSC